MAQLVTNDVPAFQTVLALTKRWCSDVMDEVSGFDDVYGTRVDEVENKSRDGFIAFTEGGFDGVGYGTMSYAWGSGCAPKVIEPYIESGLNDAREEWDRQNPEHTLEWIEDSEADDIARTQLQMFGLKDGFPTSRDRWREKWYEFEHGWLSEGGTYFYKARVLFFDADNHRNSTGKPEALFCVGINTDFEYGRDSIPWMSCYGAKTQQTEWLWEKNVPVSQLTEELIEQFIDEATSALRDA